MRTRTLSSLIESLETRTLLSSVAPVGSQFNLGYTPYSDPNSTINRLGHKDATDAQGNILAMSVNPATATVQIQSFHPDGTARSALFDTGISSLNDMANIAVSGDGSTFVIAWIGHAVASNPPTKSGSYWSDYARTFSLNPITPSGGIDTQIAAKSSPIALIGASTKEQLFSPFTAMDYSGNFVVDWPYGSAWQVPDTGIHAQMFTATGSTVGKLIEVSTILGSHHLYPMIAMNRTPGISGNFVIAWQATALPSVSGGTYARLFKNGVAVKKSDIQVTTNLSISNVAMGPDGGFSVLYVAPDAGANGEYLQRFDPNANVLGNAVLVNQDQSVDAFRGRIAINSNGDFLVSWCTGDNSGAGSAQVWAQAFAANGTPIGDNFSVGSNDGLYLDVVAQPNDTFAVIWGDHHIGSTWGQEYQILA